MEELDGFFDVLRLYKENFKTALAFGILLGFVLLFLPFQTINLNFTTGSIFLDYNFINTNLFVFLLEIVAIAAYIMCLSIFVTIVTFAIRKEMSHVRITYYINEMIRKFSTKIFVFYVVYALAIAFLAALAINAGALFVDDLNVLILGVNALLLLFSMMFVFFPQAIVVDEEGIKHAFFSNFDFIWRNKRQYLFVVLVTTLMLAAVPVIELIFDQFFFVGRFISLAIVMVFIIPFTEMLKTYFYMMKFELVKRTHHIESKKLDSF